MILESSLMKNVSFCPSPFGLNALGILILSSVQQSELKRTSVAPDVWQPSCSAFTK